MHHVARSNVERFCRVRSSGYRVDWDDVYAPRLVGFPVNLCYAQWIRSTGMSRTIYVFDPTTFIEGEHSRQMRYRPAIGSDFSVLVKLH